jgi:hypothetical protein
MSLLAAEPFDFADRETLDTDTRQSFFDLIELERLDYCLDLLHMTPLGNAGKAHLPSVPLPL